MSPELSAPLRTKEQAMEDLIANVNRDWREKVVQPLIARYEAQFAGAYDGLSLEECEAEIDRQMAEVSRQGRMVKRGLQAFVWGHDTQCQCYARVRLLKQRKAHLIQVANSAGLARIIGGAAA